MLNYDIFFVLPRKSNDKFTNLFNLWNYIFSNVSWSSSSVIVLFLKQDNIVWNNDVSFLFNFIIVHRYQNDFDPKNEVLNAEFQGYMRILSDIKRY